MYITPNLGEIDLKISIVLAVPVALPTPIRLIRYAGILSKNHEVTVILPKIYRQSHYITEDKLFRRLQSFQKTIKDESKHKGYQIVFSSFLALPTVPPSEYFKLLRRNFFHIPKGDIIHFVTPSLNVIPSMISKYLNGSKTLFEIEDLVSAIEHPPPFKRLKKLYAWFVERSLPFRVDSNVVCTFELKRWLESMGVPTHKIFRIPIATLTEMFQNGNPNRIRAKFEFTEKLIVYTGMFMSLKFGDFDILISAMKKILQKRQDVKLLVIGEGKERFKAEMMVDKRGLTENIIFVGYFLQKDLVDALSAADVLVLPMRDNLINRLRFPTKLCEYLATGRPTVASAVGEVKRIITHGKDGLLCKPGDPESMAECILKVLNDDELAHSLGKEARITSEKYNIKRVASLLEDVYKATLHKSITP